MARIAEVSQVFRDQLAVFELDGVTKVTGQTSGDFTFITWVDGVQYTGPNVVAIAEIAGTPGEYLITFTPPTVGFWKIETLAAYSSELVSVDVEVSSTSNDENYEAIVGVVGNQIRFPFYEELGSGAPETGLTLGSYTLVAVQNGAVIGTPAAALSLTMIEVNSSTAAGEYELILTPQVEGVLTIRLERGTARRRWIMRVGRRGIIDLAAAMDGSVTRQKITTQTSGGSPIADVRVRLFSGTTFVTQGFSDTAGEIYFDLAAGTYTSYMSKDLYDFTAVNPTTITVIAGDETAPIVDTFLPASASVGSRLALRGRFFDLTTADNEVTFTTSTTLATVVAEAVDAVGELVVVTVPTIGLSQSTVQVQKPDPNNLGQKLKSNAVLLAIA